MKWMGIFLLTMCMVTVLIFVSMALYAPMWVFFVEMAVIAALYACVLYTALSRRDGRKSSSPADTQLSE
ncbi:hypothetical protein [Alicyclobacillus fodiniaquatilis]|uniref:Uncharacterized protein n=1 Tax=Alicyclobacillus fodiniaquatilis TaxID=1661150 RepID=A0ABW4JQ99_9BACL